MRSSPSSRADTIIFLGAANDAFDVLRERQRHGAAALAVLFFGRDYFQNKPGMRGLLELVAASSERGALSHRDRQRALLEETVACALQKKVLFHYVHDFLAPDIDRGRNPVLQELLRMRKGVVEQGAKSSICRRTRRARWGFRGSPISCTSPRSVTGGWPTR